MAYTPDGRGRGAWTRTGGLLPNKPGGTGTFGYYRLNGSGETPVGAAWPKGSDTSDAARAVNAGARALQALCGLSGADLDGWFGPMTDKALRAAQGRLGIAADGVAGPQTLKALLTKPITDAATAANVPVKYLGGLISTESLFDPGAVGYTTPNDHGLPQVNLAAFSATSTEPISYEQAMDPGFSLPWTAKRMRTTFDRWDGKTAGGIDPWEVAILNHNSPYNGQRLATSGAYPSTQAQQYVASVLSGW